jgi:putative transposase
MRGFRSIASLQKFAAVNAQIYNHFNFWRHLTSRETFETRREAAVTEWKSLVGRFN